MSEKISRPWIETDLLPLLNLAMLVIPAVAMAMQLGSAAAGLVAATEPTDVAQLETPARPHARVQADEQPRPSQDRAPDDLDLIVTANPEPAGDRSSWSADPLLGYGI